MSTSQSWSEEVSSLFRRLVDAVALLASNASYQRAWLTGQQLCPLADELGLEFGDAYDALVWRLDDVGLDEQATARLTALNTSLEQMSGQQHAQLWTCDALDAEPFWGEVRSLAGELLPALARRLRLGDA